MTSATLNEQIALLRLAKLKPGEAQELGEYFAMSFSTREDLNWFKCEPAFRLKLVPENMPDAQRFTLAAAALVLAAEDAALTPFDRWLRKTYTDEEINKFSFREIDLMRRGFDGATNG